MSSVFSVLSDSEDISSFSQKNEAENVIFSDEVDVITPTPSTSNSHHNTAQNEKDSLLFQHPQLSQLSQPLPPTNSNKVKVLSTLGNSKINKAKAKTLKKMIKEGKEIVASKEPKTVSDIFQQTMQGLQQLSAMSDCHAQSEIAQTISHLIHAKEGTSSHTKSSIEDFQLLHNKMNLLLQKQNTINSNTKATEVAVLKATSTAKETSTATKQLINNVQQLKSSASGANKQKSASSTADADTASITAKNTAAKLTFAQKAAENLEKPWTTVTAKATAVKTKTEKKQSTLRDRRVLLTANEPISASFNSMQYRDTVNNALKQANIKNVLIATATVSRSQNSIILTTAEDNTAEDLMKHKEI